MISSALAHIVIAVFPAGAIAAAVMDATSFTIPNRLTLAIAASFYPVALILGLPLATIGACTAIGVLALVVGIGLFAMNWCGGGDAKLLAACALWLGIPAILPFLFSMSVAGGVIALGLVLARKMMLGAYVAAGPAWIGRLLEPGLVMARKMKLGAHMPEAPAWLGRVLAPGVAMARKMMPGAPAAGGPSWIGRLLQPEEALPYGVAIALGALFAFPSSPVFAALSAH